MDQDLFQLSGFPLRSQEYHLETLVNQLMVKNAENC